MQYEEILKLVKGVAEAGLTNFEYTEGKYSHFHELPGK